MLDHSYIVRYSTDHKFVVWVCNRYGQALMPVAECKTARDALVHVERMSRLVGLVAP